MENKIKIFTAIAQANAAMLEAMREASANDEIYNRLTLIQDQIEAEMENLR
jgi:gamma-glutamyl phosphate reductase